jgi:16S rRNA (cytosine967-C5)-methyltransferase
MSEEVKDPPARPRREPPSGRSIAARVLERVAKDDAFAAAALDVELARYPELDSRDRGLATEIVYGALRAHSVLLERLGRNAPRGLPADTVVVAHLLVAAYQILLLDRVPAHAAVDAAVTAIRTGRGPKVAGFANALLRKLSPDGARLDRERAIVESAPKWLFAELDRTVGADEARALLGAVPSEERVSIRVARELPWIVSDAERGRASPLARLVPRSGDLRRREGYDSGAFTLQEEGAQVVVLALGARAGDRVLDACAGRGQKTALLRERVGPDAELWATDLYAEKLATQVDEFRRLGLEPAKTAAVDWTVGAGPVPSGFDRVLVDAPCTGTGTLRHRPEIALRLKKSDPKRMGELGEAILRRASARAKIGGRIVFAVCSVLPDECEAVVARVLDVLEPAPFDAPELQHLVAPDQTSLRLTPLRHGTDGFFIASFRRRA